MRLHTRSSQNCNMLPSTTLLEKKISLFCSSLIFTHNLVYTQATLLHQSPSPALPQPLQISCLPPFSLFSSRPCLPAATSQHPSALLCSLKTPLCHAAAPTPSTCKSRCTHAPRPTNTPPHKPRCSLNMPASPAVLNTAPPHKACPSTPRRCIITMPPRCPTSPHRHCITMPCRKPYDATTHAVTDGTSTTQLDKPHKRR
jgi:hypothetical protein